MPSMTMETHPNQRDLPTEDTHRVESVLATLETLTADFTGELTLNGHEMSSFSSMFSHLRTQLTVIDDDSPKAQRALELMTKFDLNYRKAREDMEAETVLVNKPTDDDQEYAE